MTTADLRDIRISIEKEVYDISESYTLGNINKCQFISAIEQIPGGQIKELDNGFAVTIDLSSESTLYVYIPDRKKYSQVFIKKQLQVKSEIIVQEVQRQRQVRLED